MVEAETLSWKSTWVVGATGSCGDVEDCRDALGVALGGQGLGGGRVWGIGGDVDLPGDSVFGRVGHGLVSCHVGGGLRRSAGVHDAARHADAGQLGNAVGELPQLPDLFGSSTGPQCDVEGVGHAVRRIRL